MNSQNSELLNKSFSQHNRLPQAGVTSIEYALIASVISVAVIAALRAAGDENLNIWTYWSGRVSAAFIGV